MKTFFSALVFVLSWSYLSLAQVVSAPAAAPAPAVAVVAPAVGIMGWISAHGGFQAAILLLVGSALTLLSAIRQVLYKFDGLDLTQPLPPQYAKLSVLNKVCIVLGQIVDFISGNTQHT